MLRADVVVAQTTRFVLREDDDLASRLGEALEHAERQRSESYAALISRILNFIDPRGAVTSRRFSFDRYSISCLRFSYPSGVRITSFNWPPERKTRGAKAPSRAGMLPTREDGRQPLLPVPFPALCR